MASQAKAQSDVNFVGIEWASRYYRYAVDRMYRKALGNVRMVRTDAAAFIAGRVACRCVDCYHIYFPDPWHKKRHNKRRFICEKNLRQLLRTLKNEGTINIATDHSDYFEQMQAVLLDSDLAKLHLEQIPFVKPIGAEEGELTGTNFERKYIVEGRKINTIAVKKRSKDDK